MPHALVTLPDVYESVTRRVAVTAVEQLSRVMRLPADTNVYLPGNTESVPMNGGSFNECWDPGVKYPAEAKLAIRYNESINEDNTLTATVNKPQQMPWFLDEARDIVIRPVYRYVALDITIEYTAPNITVAQRWVDEMRSRISMGRAELYQDLEYHYAIPDPVMALLTHLHDTKESSQSPTGEDFDTWFDTHRLTPVKTATTLAGTSPTRVIPEHQYEVLGWFDFTASPPTPEKDGHDSGSYTSTINYRLHYNRPVQMYCRYPILVHNNPVAEEFRARVPFTPPYAHDRKVSSRKGNFDEMMRLMDFKGVPYIHEPPSDDWVPPTQPKDRLTFFTGLLVISPDDPHTLMNLANLGDMTFSPFFLEYFYTQGDKIFDPDRSIFEFRLYENNGLLTTRQLSLTGVTVTSIKALDPTKFYHLQISLKRNWLTLTSDAVECLRRYPTVVYWSLRALGIMLGSNKSPEKRKLLGDSRPRPPSPECPGEGSIIGPPSGSVTRPPGWEDWPGGVWPWPWLDDGWVGVPWPGGVPGGWLETEWPYFDPNWGGHEINWDGEGSWNGGSWPGSGPFPGWDRYPGNNAGSGGGGGSWPGGGSGNGFPNWGGYPGMGFPDYDPEDYPDNWPGMGLYPGGVIPGKDIQDAIDQTGGTSPGSPNQNPYRHADQRLGMMTVMYSEILTQKYSLR